MGRQRDTAQIARDRKKIGELYLKGTLQADIAAKLSIDQSTVSRDIKALFAEWRKSALVDINEAKARELAKIDALELTYWAAWERSCEDAETTVKKTKGSVKRYQDDDGQFIVERPAEVDQTSKGQTGDSRFLQGVQWCIDKRCKILGIDAPQRLEHTGRDGEPIQTSNVLTIVEYGNET